MALTNTPITHTTHGFSGSREGSSLVGATPWEASQEQWNKKRDPWFWLHSVVTLPSDVRETSSLLSACLLSCEMGGGASL